jgi:hypothetical protein
MKKVAIVITGDVRQCEATDILIEKFKEFDVFCGSYTKHANYIKQLGKTNKSILIDPEKDIRCPKGLVSSQMQQNMLQWLHLDNIIKTFKPDLLQYEVIVKFRFDCIMDKDNYYEVLYNVKPESNILYGGGAPHHQVDIVFYARSDTFIKIFEYFYDSITYLHKDRNSEDSFLKSWLSDPFFIDHLKMQNITSEIPSAFRALIIRGNYNKVLADGNKRLYKNNALLGKFS